MIAYREVADKNLIDEEILEYIPDKCDCGGDVEFTENMTQISCSNNNCFYKVGARLARMVEILKVDGWGEATCVAFAKGYKMRSPYQAFELYKAIELNRRIDGIASFENKIKAICDPKLRQGKKLWEVVRLGVIPNIDTTAYKLFKGYNSVKEFYDDLEDQQLVMVSSRLGLKDNAGTMSIGIYNILLAYRDELEYAEKHFELESEDNSTDIVIAITGEVDGYSSKELFIKHLNDKYKGKYMFVYRASISKQTDILICDRDTNSTKVQKARKYNSQVNKGGKFGDELILICRSVEIDKMIGE